MISSFLFYTRISTLQCFSLLIHSTFLIYCLYITFCSFPPQLVPFLWWKNNFFLSKQGQIAVNPIPTGCPSKKFCRELLTPTTLYLSFILKISWTSLITGLQIGQKNGSSNSSCNFCVIILFWWSISSSMMFLKSFLYRIFHQNKVSQTKETKRRKRRKYMRSERKMLHSLAKSI